MPTGIDVERILEQARRRETRIEKKPSLPKRKLPDPLPLVSVIHTLLCIQFAMLVYVEKLHVMVVLRSFDSTQEDAQNPFPDMDDTPPGMRVFQRGEEAGKQPLRADSQTIVMETPPPKAKRAGTEDLSGSLSKKVRYALRRPQSVDRQSDSERKDHAKRTQKQLQQEFEQAGDTQEQQDPGTEGANNSRASSKAKPRAKAKTKGVARKMKGTAEDDESKAPTKPNKGSGKKSKAKDDESEAPTKPQKGSGKKGKAQEDESEGPTKPQNGSGKKGKAQEDESEGPTKPQKGSGKKGKAQEDESEAPTKPQNGSGKKGKVEEDESEAPTKPQKGSGKKGKVEEDESEAPTKLNSASKKTESKKRAAEDHRTAGANAEPQEIGTQAAAVPRQSEEAGP